MGNKKGRHIVIKENEEFLIEIEGFFVIKGKNDEFMLYPWDKIDYVRINDSPIHVKLKPYHRYNTEI